MLHLGVDFSFIRPTEYLVHPASVQDRCCDRNKLALSGITDARPLSLSCRRIKQLLISQLSQAVLMSVQSLAVFTGSWQAIPRPRLHRMERRNTP
ncbi:hypothetical protein Q8A67_011674 [Cirrhinus molitorella]|uniref:Uncharacterized protein n=1 Tax=Cirrhinus molitorella TaxID=172907 RepID=A0AA88PZW0_9TELE|nr:hypothetical protein Q8A67_011674 [Cirrhinus molitorella]